MRASWRLIRTGEAAGPLQIGIDRAVLESSREGHAPPTLRLYRFSPPAVTIGRFQRASDVDLEWCAAQGVDVVRRPTGGRGVLHADEITYSIVAGRDDGVPRGTAAAYRHLSSALVAAYHLLGVDAELTTRDRGAGDSGACYLHATSADLSFGARKLSGSAQVWRGSSVLQHGSLVVSRAIDLEASAFRLTGDAPQMLSERTTTLFEVLGRRPTAAQIEEAVAEGLMLALNVDLVEGELSHRELARARELAREHDLLAGGAADDREGVLQVEGV